MSIMEQFAHQGDTQWFKIDQIPLGAKKTDKKFIAASERSGSFHALFGAYDMYELHGSFIIETKEDCVLNHSLAKHLRDCKLTLDEAKILTKKDHMHTVIPKGIYRVGIQQRFNPRENHRRRITD